MKKNTILRVRLKMTLIKPDDNREEKSKMSPWGNSHTHLVVVKKSDVNLFPFAIFQPNY